MRKYETTWDLKEVNRLAREGYVLHTAVAVGGLVQYVMEWVEIREPFTDIRYKDTSQFGDH